MCHWTVTFCTENVNRQSALTLQLTIFLILPTWTWFLCSRLYTEKKLALKKSHKIPKRIMNEIFKLTWQKSKNGYFTMIINISFLKCWYTFQRLFRWNWHSNMIQKENGGLQCLNVCRNVSSVLVINQYCYENSMLLEISSWHILLELFSHYNLNNTMCFCLCLFVLIWNWYIHLQQICCLYKCWTISKTQSCVHQELINIVVDGANIYVHFQLIYCQ